MICQKICVSAEGCNYADKHGLHWLFFIFQFSIFNFRFSFLFFFIFPFNFFQFLMFESEGSFICTSLLASLLIQ